MANKGNVTLKLTDVYGQLLHDQARLVFTNLRTQSANFFTQVTLTGQPLTVTGVPAFPDGNWRLDINLSRYRDKSVFISIPSGGVVQVEETCFVDPVQVTPVLPVLESDSRWSALRAVMSVDYAELSIEQKAGLLNLYAKMSHVSTKNVFRYITKIFEVKPARIYAEAHDSLIALLKGDAESYHVVSGSLHKFPNAWIPLQGDYSWKTFESVGNLQLTLARISTDRVCVDADLDDHQGLKHAFDVIKHKFSGDTHPYDIHQVLVKYQNIDPGYYFKNPQLE